MLDSIYLETMCMRMTRLLLPFTHGIDGFAITSALTLARRFDATLVPLSLIHAPKAPGKEPRWENIQQSRDFLEFVQHKAARSGVPVERVELYTQNPVSSIRVFAQEMECAGIVLAVRKGAGVLLDTSEVKQLLEENRTPLHLISLPTRGSLLAWPRQLVRWFSKKSSPIPRFSSNILQPENQP